MACQPLPCPWSVSSVSTALPTLFSSSAVPCPVLLSSSRPDCRRGVFPLSPNALYRQQGAHSASGDHELAVTWRPHRVHCHRLESQSMRLNTVELLLSRRAKVKAMEHFDTVSRGRRLHFLLVY